MLHGKVVGLGKPSEGQALEFDERLKKLRESRYPSRRKSIERKKASKQEKKR